MAKLNAMAHAKTHRVVVFGAPKSGKTELVGKLSEYFKIIYIGNENGHGTLFKLPQEWQERIEVINLPDTKDYPIAIETSLKIITGAAVSICDLHGKVSCPLCKKDGGLFTDICLNDIDEDTIVVTDSLTQLAVSAINHVTKGKGDDYKFDWEDYRKQGSLMDKFLSQVQQAKFNIICISHETETEMDDGRKRLVPVAGTTSFSRNTAKYFDHVIHIEVKNRKHIAASSTTHSNTILTGSRYDIALEEDEAPNLLRIFKPDLFPAVAQKSQTTQTTPANKALSSLEQMRAKAKAGGA